MSMMTGTTRRRHPLLANASAPSCSVLLRELRPAPSCSVLLRPAPSCSVLLRPAPSCSVLLRPAPSCSVLLRPAPSCSVLLRPAPSCSVLLRPAPRETKRSVSPDRSPGHKQHSLAISAADNVAAPFAIHTHRTTLAQGGACGAVSCFGCDDYQDHTIRRSLRPKNTSNGTQSRSRAGAVRARERGCCRTLGGDYFTTSPTARPRHRRHGMKRPTGYD